jgi:antitoxin component YwqK of YwqJK toxin-antitoxin module
MNTTVENTGTDELYESQFQIELAYEEQKAKNYAGAAELFSRAIEINGSAAEAYFGRAAAYFDMNKKEEALPDFITAAAKDYKKAQSLYYAARCALVVNDGEKAGGFFNSFIQNPELIKSLCAPPADVKKLLEDLLKDAAYFELSAALPLKSPAVENDETFTHSNLNKMLSEIESKININMREAAADLFFKKGMIHIIKNEYILAAKSIRAAEFLTIIGAAARNDSSIYAVFLSAVFFINSNFGRLEIIEDIRENDLSASGACARVIFLYQLAREAVLYDANAFKSKEAPAKKNCESQVFETRKIYNQSGKLIRKIKFKNGKRFHYISYNDDGTTKEGKFIETNPGNLETYEIFYINGQPEGCVKTFRGGIKSQKILYSKCNYKNGRLHGKSQFFSKSDTAFITREAIYENGELSEEINYSREGAALIKKHEFYKDDNPVKLIVYKNNEICYIKEIEYSGAAAAEKIYGRGVDGKDYLKEVKNFYCGKLYGISRQYYPDGKIACEIPYKNDFITGYILKFYKNGGPSSVEYCYEDDYEGLCARFDEKGNLTSLKIYEYDCGGLLKP